MKKRILFGLVLLSVILLSFASCIGDRAVKDLVITEGLKLEYELGETPDFSAVRAKVIYNDDTTAEVGYDKLVFGELDTSTSGAKTLTITYEDFVAYKSVKVKGEGFDPNSHSIVKVSLPDSLATFNDSKESFINKSHPYFVGDDSRFYFKLKILAISSDKIPMTVTSYISSSQVYLEGSDTPLHDDELDMYVAIDEERNSFDFTEAAIGKTFTLTTRPRDISEDKIAKFTQSFTVTIVDGYNIYEAYELNYLTNTPNCFEFSEVDPSDTRNQIQVIDDFLASEKNAKRPETLTSVVIHNHLTITPYDIPREYFLDKNRNNGFYDDIALFDFTVTEENPNFTIHGNYFSIFTYDLPTVIAEGGNQTDNMSNMQLFYFANAYVTDMYYDHTKYSVTVNNLHIADDNSTSSDEDKTAASMLGLTAFKTKYLTLNYNNLRLEALLCSIIAEKDYQTVNINECKMSNSWHNHITLVSENTIQEEGEEPLDKSVYPRLKLNINRSVITKSGGPAIICSSALPALNNNKNSGAEVYISEDSTVESWVTGTEAWFTSMNVGISMDTVMQTLIYPLDNALQKQGSSFITEKTITGESKPRRYFNLVLVNLMLPDTSNGFDNLFQQLSGNIDIDGKATIGNKDILNMDDYVYNGKTYNFKNKTLAEVKEKNNSVTSLIMTTPSGGVAHTSASDSLKIDSGSIEADETNDYLTVFYLSFAIVFGNYHSIR